ncbi:cobyrinate a,c-diamide synthase [Acidocella sp. MX-AZ02]|uniref:cobyrinate a,c-diamide synthase n=1 Tax=Acidocella sp. MX-AZ02 TaxID=1214225 RepID=UPI00028CB941|nr:cobyrinate a,c-diamide synthase [Acidocella sp. MX-AZ02]EKM98271.1 cobyrinic acid a,c-diamide synthase [Acidocella sp. MX-AZ02]
MKGLLIAAAASGAGKTTLSLGLARAFTRRGVTVQPYKSGPDYIDPAFLAAATGRPCFNLDSWAMGAGEIGALVGRAEGAELALAEGSMGLFDGVASRGASGHGASAEIAALTGWPVLLVLDVRGQAQTAAAIASGLARFRPGLPVAGVVLNRVASPRHEKLLRAGMAQAGLRVFGALPRQEDVKVPERHLGLVQAQELPKLAALLDKAADLVGQYCDLDGLLEAAAGQALPASAPLPRPPGQRIALARDAAFSFLYPHLLEGWRAAGAEILPFSPLADEAPDESADICWLPGGYPELHAGPLAAAGRFLAGLRDFAQTRPVHGECGGYMVLGETLEDAQGQRHAMAGLLGLATSFAKRKMHLGYRRARLLAPMPGQEAGADLAGHEFHYASILAQPDAPLAQVRDAEGAPVPETGSRRGHVSGSFFHLISRLES